MVTKFEPFTLFIRQSIAINNSHYSNSLESRDYSDPNRIGTVMLYVSVTKSIASSQAYSDSLKNVSLFLLI